jgi:hypothetical protein
MVFPRKYRLAKHARSISISFCIHPDYDAMTIISPFYIHTRKIFAFLALRWPNLLSVLACSTFSSYPGKAGSDFIYQYTARTESSRRRHFHDTTGFQFFLCNNLQCLLSTAVERILIVSSFIFPTVLMRRRRATSTLRTVTGMRARGVYAYASLYKESINILLRNPP